MKIINIAIDGPSGAGKSSLAKAVAKELNMIYVDTGALYRSIGLFSKNKGVSLENIKETVNFLSEIKLDLMYENGAQKVVLNGEDVSDFIRTPEISMYASAVSAIPAVREFLLETQRSIARKTDVIMDGRDIGTVVLPFADVKIFLTASAEERARRRFLELQEKGVDTTYEEVLQDMQQRDYNDSHRAAAPLKAAQDAILLNTEGNTLEQSVELFRTTILQAIEG